MKRIVTREIQEYELYEDIQEAMKKYPELVRERKMDGSVMDEFYLHEYRYSADSSLWSPFSTHIDALLIYNNILLKDFYDGVCYCCETVNRNRVKLLYKEVEL